MFMKTFIEDEMSVTHKELASHLLVAMESLATKCERQWVIQPCKSSVQLSPSTAMEHPFDTTAVVLSFSPQQLAEQLTLSDREVFQKLDVS